MTRAICATAISPLLASPAFAKNAVAQRFDALAPVEVGGSIEITETPWFHSSGGASACATFIAAEGAGAHRSPSS